MDYLECIRSDIKEAQEAYTETKTEADTQLGKLRDKIETLEKEEDKIMKRTYDKIRCRNCGQFVDNVYPHPHEGDNVCDMGGGYSCKARTKY